MRSRLPTLGGRAAAAVQFGCGVEMPFDDGQPLGDLPGRNLEQEARAGIAGGHRPFAPGRCQRLIEKYLHRAHVLKNLLRKGPPPDLMSIHDGR